MPNREQYDLISQGRAQFLMNGEPVRTLEAVKSMAHHRALGGRAGATDGALEPGSA